VGSQPISTAVHRSPNKLGDLTPYGILPVPQSPQLIQVPPYRFPKVPGICFFRLKRGRTQRPERLFSTAGTALDR
jgi:hypothetical protein